MQQSTTDAEGDIVKSWQEQAKLLRVIAHPVRLLILEALSKGPQCVKDLNNLVDIAQPRLSQHIAALRRAKMVACHSCGALRCYYVMRPRLVKELIELLQQNHPPCVLDRRAVLLAARRNAEGLAEESKPAEVEQKQEGPL